MRTTPSPAEIRDAILDAAERLRTHYGCKKITMDDLAREAGIGKRAFVDSDEPASERLRMMGLTRVLFRFDSVKDYLPPRSVKGGTLPTFPLMTHTRRPTLLPATSALLLSALSVRKLGSKDIQENGPHC